jgi:arsenate reductase (thioredoxin)
LKFCNGGKWTPARYAAKAGTSSLRLAHWGAPDPAKAEGDHEHILHEFRNVGLLLRKRIELMLALPIAKLEKLAIQHEVEQIGKVSS